MNFKKSIIALLIVTVLSFLTLTLFFYNENMRKDSDKSDLQGQIAKLEIKETNFVLNIEMIGEKVSDILCVAQSGDGKYLSELMNGKTILIYRYTHSHCAPCYEEQIYLLQEIFKDFPQVVGILSSYLNRMDFLLFMRGKTLEVPIYQVSFNSFDWIMEDYDVPYYFVLHSDMKISHIYIPNKAYPESNKQYLEGVKRFLLE